MLKTSMDLEFDKICRVCLKPSDNMDPIFNKTGMSLIQKFEYLSIMLSHNDGLPKNICEFCKSKLLLAYQFKEEAVRNEEQLRLKCPALFIESKTPDIEEIEIIEQPPESDEIVFSIKIEAPQSSVKVKESQPAICQSKKILKSAYLNKSIKSEKIVTNGKTVYKKECPVCHRMQQNLKQHLLIHSNERKYKCQICDKSFSQISNLNIHTRLHDPEGTKDRYKCEQCDTTFTDPRSLRRHEAKHTGERKYQCDLCSKKFLYSHNLLNHKRSHLQDKRYKCKEKGCEKAYVTGGELKRHINWHLKQNETNKKKIK